MKNLFSKIFKIIKLIDNFCLLSKFKAQSYLMNLLDLRILENDCYFPQNFTVLIIKYSNNDKTIGFKN